MYISIGREELIEFFQIFVCILFVLMIVVWVLHFFVKREDKNKKLVTQKVKVLEKTQQGNIAWYAVECEDGTRLKLRSFQANNIIIAVGDEGLLSYKGQTIQSFQRNSK